MRRRLYVELPFASNSMLVNSATWGLVVIVLTFLAGVGTVMTASEWVSYLMAVGFLAAAALYGGTFFASYGLTDGSRP